MNEYKIVVGVLALVITVFGYAIYFVHMAQGKTKPHAFSWFVWGMLTAIAFAAQVAEGGGAGAWVMGLTAVACFCISAFAYFKGARDFVWFDWFALVSAGIALLLWWLAHSPLWSVVLITLTDAFGFLPTMRKSYFRPHEETASIFVISSIKFILSIFALETYTLATWLYPAYLIVANGLVATTLFIRRWQLKKGLRDHGRI